MWFCWCICPCYMSWSYKSYFLIELLFVCWDPLLLVLLRLSGIITFFSCLYRYPSSLHKLVISCFPYLADIQEHNNKWDGKRHEVQLSQGTRWQIQKSIWPWGAQELFRLLPEGVQRGYWEGCADIAAWWGNGSGPDKKCSLAGWWERPTSCEWHWPFFHRFTSELKIPSPKLCQVLQSQ